MENLIAKPIFVALALAIWAVSSSAADATGRQINQTNQINCQQAASWADKNSLLACQ